MSFQIENTVLQMEIIQNYGEHIETATISNNLQYIVSGGDDNFIIWNYQTYSRVKIIKLDSLIQICKFTDDSRLLYVGTKYALYQIFVHNKFKLLFKQKLKKPLTNIHCISKTIILTSFVNGLITKYNATLRQQLFSIQAHYGQIYGLDYNKGIISSGSQDRSIKLWNGNDGTLIIEKQNAHNSFIKQVMFISNLQLISLDCNMHVTIWNINYQKKQLESYQMLDDAYNISLVQDQYIITIGRKFIKIYTFNIQQVRQFDINKEQLLKGIVQNQIDCSYNVIQPNNLKALIIKLNSLSMFQKQSLWVFKFLTIK